MLRNMEINVTTFAVVWIEIEIIIIAIHIASVTTFAVVWIEISSSINSTG